MPPYKHQKTKPDPPGPDKVVAFYYEDVDGATAIYSHRVLAARKAKLDPDGDRYLLDTTSDQTKRGWTKEGSPAFYAFTTPKLGTTPIYRHVSLANSTGSGPGSYERYDMQRQGDADWQDATVPAFYALKIGYKVHDKAAEISAPDQQENVVQLTSHLDGATWVWIDICAGWCGPSRDSAKQTTAFVEHVNSQGLKLKVFTVLTDGRNMRASAWSEADWWANTFKLTDSVVHCGGDPDSDLRQLVSRTPSRTARTVPGTRRPCSSTRKALSATSSLESTSTCSSPILRSTRGKPCRRSLRASRFLRSFRTGGSNHQIPRRRCNRSGGLRHESGTRLMPKGPHRRRVRYCPMMW
jgi:hypothetical protein